MRIEIKDIKKQDYKNAISFAISGMNFNRYVSNRFLLSLYGRYFWYLELCNATQVIAAYMGDELVGILLADIIGETKKHRSFGKMLYVKIFDFLQHFFFKDGVSVYDEANKQMLKEYKCSNQPDGEIRFLAAKPNINGKGIGTILLNELERIAREKVIYLFTDTNCTYQFYEKRGFIRVGEKDILLDLKTNKAPLKCLLYVKEM